MLKERLPDFYQELSAALASTNRADILEQLPTLTIERFTLDEAEHAMYIYVAGTRVLNDVEKGVIGVKHRECLTLNSLQGMVVLDIDNFNRVMGIEVLDRPDVEAVMKTCP